MQSVLAKVFNTDPVVEDLPRVIHDILTSVTGGDASAMKWIFNWVAAKVQRPDRLMVTAVVHSCRGARPEGARNAPGHLLARVRSAALLPAPTSLASPTAMMALHK